MLKLSKLRILLALIAILCTVLLVASNVVIFGLAWDALMLEFAKDMTDYDTEEARAALALGDDLVREMSEDSMVLLKNNGALPLKKDDRRINLFGYGSTELGFIYSGGGSSGTILNIDSADSALINKIRVSPKKAFEAEGFKINEDLYKIYTDFSSYNATIERGIANITQPNASVYTDSVINAAKVFSETAAIVISRGGSESAEIPLDYLKLTAAETGMINRVKASFDRVIVLLNTCQPIEAGFLNDPAIDAALYVGIPGQSGAIAIPRIFKGYTEVEESEDAPDGIRAVTPSGKLADTYAYSTREYNPTDANMFPTSAGDGEISYTEGIYIGYKWYETAYVDGYLDRVSNEYGEGYAGVVQYPFGFGMSYADFTWKVEDISIPLGSNLTAGSVIEFKVRVTNTGKVPGKEVVQIYSTAQYHDGEIEKPHVKLVAFDKTVQLDPGKTQALSFKISAYDLAVYDAYDMNENRHTGYELDRGRYELKIMTDAHTLANCENKILNYNVPAPENIDKDPVTKKDVVNRFTGSGAYMGVPIDGSTVGPEIKFLSRANFGSTFPTSRTALRTNQSKINEANNALNTRYDTDVMPTTDAKNGLFLVEREDGNNLTMADLTGGSGAQPTKFNDELMMELGSNFDLAKWDDLLDQMNVEEIYNMCENGYFQTAAALSIGKTQRKDADGPAGIHVGSATSADKGQFTAFPAEVLTGCSWSQKTAYAMGQAQGVIGDATNIHGWYAPGLNLHRNPYSGRYFEYYSEDSLIAGKLAAEVVRGAKTKGLVCYMKHFAVSEEGKNPDNVKTWITEQALRETYLKPFEIAVKEGGANAIMTSFNCIGAVWAGACDPMNNDILRDEWGFRGSLVSDWAIGSANGLYRPDYMDVNQGIRAGNDFMLGNKSGSPVRDRESATTLSCARRAVKNIVFTYTNTYTTARNYQMNPDADDKYDVMLGTALTEQGSSPIPYLIGIGANVLFALSIAVCVVFYIINKPKSKATAE